MSICVDENTRVVYQGMTGKAARLPSARAKGYGTQVVAGLTRVGRAPRSRGSPYSRTCPKRRDKRERFVYFVPAPGVQGAVMEAAEAGIKFIVVITEGETAQDEARFYNRLKRDFPNVRLLGPNCPVISPQGSATLASPPVTSPCPAGRSAS